MDMGHTGVNILQKNGISTGTKISDIWNSTGFFIAFHPFCRNFTVILHFIQTFPAHLYRLNSKYLPLGTHAQALVGTS